MNNVKIIKPVKENFDVLKKRAKIENDSGTIISIIIGGISIVILITLITLIYKYFFDKSPTPTSPTPTPPTPTPSTPSVEQTPNATCSEICSASHYSQRDYIIEYNTELNLNSSCDEIKDYIIYYLDYNYIDSFDIIDEDRINLTNDRKKELITVLENSIDMDLDNGRRGSGIRFKFCCPTEQNCLL
tara:strand:- start:46 stop:606 length:561 start_codon:yes stop_codon:yes gene_type:complete